MRDADPARLIRRYARRTLARLDGERRIPGSTTPKLHGFQRTGLSMLYGALTVFWGVGVVIPGPIVQRVGCGVVALAFGSSTWHAAVHGRDEVGDDDHQT